MTASACSEDLSHLFILDPCQGGYIIRIRPAAGSEVVHRRPVIISTVWKKNPIPIPDHRQKIHNVRYVQKRQPPTNTLRHFPPIRFG